MEVIETMTPEEVRPSAKRESGQVSASFTHFLSLAILQEPQSLPRKAIAKSIFFLEWHSGQVSPIREEIVWLDVLIRL